MLSLHSCEADDSAFLAAATTLIAGAALDNRVSDVWTVHLDNWFGDRWLGFQGKILGIAGVRSRTLTGQLVYPPFHPHRVLSEQRFTLSERGDFRPGELGGHRIHIHQRSEHNLRRDITGPALYAWYSGNTHRADKGVVMVYVVDEERFAAWHAMFQRGGSWRLVRTVGISRARCLFFLERGTALAG